MPTLTVSAPAPTAQGQSDPHAGEANEIAREDLWAQQAMALLAVLQLVLTGAGLWLIFETLRETRKAVKEAEGGTEAALLAAKAGIESNAISRTIAEQSAKQFEVERTARDRENIPAVLVVDAAFKELDEGIGEITLTIENVGRQAAIDVYVLSREHYFMPEGHWYEERMSVAYAATWLPKVPKDGKRRAGAIGVNPRKITIPAHSRGQELRNCIITKGAVVYSDADGRDYISQFFYWLGDYAAKRDVSVPMNSGTLRMATFKPYDGPELRDRDGY